MRLLYTFLFLLISSCSYQRITHEQSEVVIDGVNIDQSLEIAEFMMNRVDKKGKAKPMSLGYWAMRAQYITPPQAAEIDRVYWTTIDSIESEFHLWHYTWAIADMYRLGSPEVKKRLQAAYEDALSRAVSIDKEKFVAGTTLHLGFFHGGGWRAAKNFLVVPGERKFTQSADEYIEKRERN